jgi:hypothetical protein
MSTGQRSLETCTSHRTADPLNAKRTDSWTTPRIDVVVVTGAPPRANVRAHIRFLERDGRWQLNLETHEKDVLNIRTKRFKFRLLNTPIEPSFWDSYKRLMRP